MATVSEWADDYARVLVLIGPETHHEVTKALTPVLIRTEAELSGMTQETLVASSMYLTRLLVRAVRDRARDHGREASDVLEELFATFRLDETDVILDMMRGTDPGESE